jgi:hypothetical protein
MSEFDLTKIRIPAGGGAAFEVTNPGGDAVVQHFRAIVIAARDIRVYWEKAYEESGGGVPPDCHSSNGLVGIGQPGGVCQSCPMAQFGSDQDKRGQACKQVKQLFLLREGSGNLMPEVFLVPPTSLKNYRQHSLRLSGQLAPVWSVITEIGLNKAQSRSGFKYSQATFKTARALEAPELAKVRQYVHMFKPLLGVQQMVNVTPAPPAAPVATAPGGDEAAFE